MRQVSLTAGNSYILWVDYMVVTWHLQSHWQCTTTLKLVAWALFCKCEHWGADMLIIAVAHTAGEREGRIYPGLPDAETLVFNLLLHCLLWWLSGNKFACQCGRRGLSPWVGNIPWRREWQPTPVFLPGESQGQRSLAGYSPQGCTKSEMT